MSVKTTTIGVAFDHAAATVLASGIVIDKSKSDKLSATELANLFHQVYTMDRPVVIVEDSRMFFTAKNLFFMLEAGDAGWNLIAEHFGITITAGEFQVINSAIDIRKRIVADVKAAGPTYPFAIVPAAWSVTEHLGIKDREIRRKKSFVGENIQYSIGPKTLERVWLAASRFWTSKATLSGLGDVQANGGYHRASFYIDRVQIGCQAVHRYELEQLALHMGWAFPDPDAA